MLPLFPYSALKVDEPHFSRALTLALRGRGATAPNPLVGCVVVRDGRVVGEGFHPRAGQPHAEVFALASAASETADADVYVTLEPCRHHGRTPPCTDALIAAGVRRVLIGMHDPGEEAGGGARVLRDAGIEVAFAADSAPFEAINEGWLKLRSTGLPAVTVKCATSLDGRVAFQRGVRAAITGTDGAVVTRRLRESSHAVLVGTATVIADDPSLTVRDERGVLAEQQPLRVVLAGNSMPPADARLFTDGAGVSMVLAPNAVSDADVRRFTRELPEVVVQRYDNQLGLRGAVAALGLRGIGELLVEPGPRLLTSLWRERLIDTLVTVTAGGMAGDGAVALFGGRGDTKGESLIARMRAVETGIVGDVAATVWRPAAAGLGTEPERKY